MVACSCEILSASPAASQLRSSAALASLTDAAAKHSRAERHVGVRPGQKTAQKEAVPLTVAGSAQCVAVPQLRHVGSAVCANYLYLQPVVGDSPSEGRGCC